MYMVFDCIAVNGRRVSEQGLFQRLTAVGGQVLSPLKSKHCSCPVCTAVAQACLRVC